MAPEDEKPVYITSTDERFDENTLDDREVAETYIQAFDKLFEPASPYKHIKRDYGLSKISKVESDFCLYILNYGATIAEMIQNAQEFDKQHPENNNIGIAIALALQKRYIRQLEEVDEILNLNRSVGGFQWDAINKQIKEIRRKEHKKKKRYFASNDDMEDDNYEWR